MKYAVLIKKLLVGTTCMAALMLGTAHAKTIQWSLSDVTFDDGGTASGTFSTDSASGYLVDYNLTTTAGSDLSGYNYNNSTGSYWGDNAFSRNSFYVVLPNGSHYLNLSFQHSLTTAAGAIDAIATSSTSYPSYECDNCGSVRKVTGGEAVTGAVPEPETYALMLAGLGALGFVARRRKSL